jgi:2,5-diketo-D-gluconate reductase A
MSAAAAREAEQQLALPRIGFGTSASRDVQAQVGASLAAGFRLVDTAKQYGNEPEIGAALQAAFAAGSVSREEVFLLTKISEKDLGYDATAAGVQEALTKLTVPCIDAVLIHWPGDRADMSNPANSERRLGSWRALEELRAQGKVRNIGVSNFTIAHCQEIMAVSSTPIYANEIEVHPWLQNSELVDFCQEHNIKVGCAALILLAASCWVFACTCPTAECSHCCSAVDHADCQVVAYSPFGRPPRSDVMSDPVLQSIAAKLGATPGELILRWMVQRGLYPIPKAESREHIQANFAAASKAMDPAQRLDSDTMLQIGELDRGHRVFADPVSD